MSAFISTTGTPDWMMVMISPNVGVITQSLKDEDASVSVLSELIVLSWTGTVLIGSETNV